MRKYLRAIAHAKMKKEGVRKINKPRYDNHGRIRPSLFATYWRKYC